MLLIGSSHTDIRGFVLVVVISSVLLGKELAILSANQISSHEASRVALLRRNQSRIHVSVIGLEMILVQLKKYQSLGAGTPAAPP